MTNHEWEDLLDRHLRGELSDAEKEQLAEILDTDSEKRKAFVEFANWDTLFTEAMREQAPTPAIPSNTRSWLRIANLSQMLLAVSAVVIVALAIQLSFDQKGRGEPDVVTIAAMSGSFHWIGNGGRVQQNLAPGDKLPGGTIEGMGPDSWIELQFNDNSRFMITGNSVLTYSDHGQKELHLKEGVFSAAVEPQPTDRPMLLHTRTASLKVLGTQFNVDASLFSTTLNVSEGKVRVERLSDGKNVDVTAGFRVVAAPEHDMALSPVPRSVHHWKSRLDRGARGTMGQWSAGSDAERAQLRASPYVTESGQTIYTASFGVSVGDRPPVVLRPNSKIQVKGKMSSPHDVFVGITVRKPNGEFAGRFQLIHPASSFEAGQPFDIALPLDDFQLDPSLKRVKDRLPPTPYGHTIEAIWCHTLYDPVGLSIYEIDLDTAN